jgi:hypothetical protein
MNFTKDELAAWLKKHGRSREWLAEATGKSVGTIHNWFSNRSIPEDAKTTISLLMERDMQAAADALPPDDSGLITFTTSEFERIERARAAVGNPSRPDFYRDAIIQFVDDIEEDEKDAVRLDDLALLADADADQEAPGPMERRLVTYPRGTRSGSGSGSRRKKPK